LLGTGILSHEKEMIVADRLMGPDMFSGWGVRTLSENETAYQPMDYQRGAVWPHENGYMASEMAKLGLSENAHRIFEGMLSTARFRPDSRLPELFCGFARGRNEAPIRYPVACVPQAWAAGCWFQMLFGMINVELDGLHNKLIVRAPALPAWLGTVTITGLKVADSEIDLEFTPTDSGKTQCRVTRQFGEVEVVFES
jgi:glycogen debranching enzyme